MTGRIIHTDEDIAEGMAWLCARDPVLASAYTDVLATIGPLPLRRRTDGFAQVLSAIIGQQVSVASAQAVWTRMEGAGIITPQACLDATNDELKALGLSRQKVRYARELARADIDYVALRDLPDEDVIKTLVAVPGIGPWTAEVYAMFSLGRADVFAPGDLAMQEAARILYDLPERPKEAAFRKMALQWSPWRSVAARLLWAYYQMNKDRDGIR